MGKVPCYMVLLTALGHIGFISLNPAPPCRTLHPSQHFDERFIAQALRRLCKLAYGKVRLLLPGARLAKGHATNLYHRRVQARIICPTAYPTLLLLFVSCLDQEALLPSVRVRCSRLRSNNHTRAYR